MKGWEAEGSRDSHCWSSSCLVFLSVSWSECTCISSQHNRIFCSVETLPQCYPQTGKFSYHIHWLIWESRCVYMYVYMYICIYHKELLTALERHLRTYLTATDTSWPVRPLEQCHSKSSIISVLQKHQKYILHLKNSMELLIKVYRRQVHNYWSSTYVFTITLGHFQDTVDILFFKFAYKICILSPMTLTKITIMLINISKHKYQTFYWKNLRTEPPHT